MPCSPRLRLLLRLLVLLVLHRLLGLMMTAAAAGKCEAIRLAIGRVGEVGERGASSCAILNNLAPIGVCVCVYVCMCTRVRVHFNNTS